MSSGNMTHNTEVGGIGLVTVLLALAFLFWWPGPFRYEYRGAKAEIRIDRISHQVWDYNAQRGWVRR